MKETQFHVKVSMWKVNSLSDNSSPIRKDPKKATQHAVQKTLLLVIDQFVSAIAWSINFNRRKVITNLAFFHMFEYKAKFLAPFNIEFTKKSLKFSVSKLLSLCAIFRSDKYILLTVAVERFFVFGKTTSLGT